MSSGTNSLKPMMLSQLQSAMAHSYDVPLQLINDKGLATSGYTGNIPYLSAGYQLLLCYFSSILNTKRFAYPRALDLGVTTGD